MEQSARSHDCLPRGSAAGYKASQRNIVPSFDDGDTEIAHFYSGIGNAVVPPIVASIGNKLIECVRS